MTCLWYPRVSPPEILFLWFETSGSLVGGTPYRGSCPPDSFHISIPFPRSSLYSGTVEDLCYLSTRVFSNGLLVPQFQRIYTATRTYLEFAPLDLPVCIPLCNQLHKCPMTCQSCWCDRHYRYLNPIDRNSCHNTIIT